jgi:hypothetical protein
LYHPWKLNEEFACEDRHHGDFEQVKQSSREQFTPEVGEDCWEHEVNIPYNTNSLQYINNRNKTADVKELARRLESERERDCFGDSSGRAFAGVSSEDTFPVPIRQAATRKARSKRNSAATSPFPLLLRFFQRAAKTSRDSNHCHRTPQPQLYHLRELQEKFTGESSNKDDHQWEVIQ